MKLFTLISVVAALAAAAPSPENAKRHRTSKQKIYYGRSFAGDESSGVRFDGYNSKSCGGQVMMGFDDTGGASGLVYGTGYQVKKAVTQIFAYKTSKDLQAGQRLEFYSTKNNDKCGNLMQKHSVKDGIKANTCYRIGNGNVPMTCVKIVHGD